MEQVNGENFIDMYIQYTSETECPTFFHRWCAVTALSAYLGRRTFFSHGHFTLYPNLYTLLIGSPGTKKSSAIKIAAKLLKQAGYNTFAAKKTRQEKFLLDLAEQAELQGMSEDSEYDILDQNLFGDANSQQEFYEGKPPAECLIAADEFNNFIGMNNLDFISILGELWDFEGVFDYKLKSSKSVYIPDPTISILGGNTPTGMAQAFPPESIGQGFFSRLLLVFAEPTGVKYTFPPTPCADMQAKLIAKLHEIKVRVSGEMHMTEEAKQLLDTIYQKWKQIGDVRFDSYANRRLTHLIKLTVVLTASRVSNTIGREDVIAANTLLTYTEQLMPKALGEFGRSKNSVASHKVMEVIDNAMLPLSVKDIWKVLHQDIDSRNQLIEILMDLQVAEKVQSVEGGYLPVKTPINSNIPNAINWNLLTEKEREILCI